MSIRLYYDQQTLRDFSAHVVAHQAISDGVSVCLDQTAFYPTSGGQPHDTGTLSQIPVLDVWEDEAGAVWHRLSRLPDGDVVQGHIDWERRFDHMQQHTGQHLLSAIFAEHFDAPTLGFHLGREASTIDLAYADLTWDVVFEVETRVNQVVWEDRVVTARFVKPEELARLSLRKPPPVTEHVRVVSVPGIDASACGGTHVARTGEIGLVKVTNIERYKGGSRVTFLCGGRALADYRRALGILQDVSMSLTVGQDEVPDAVGRLREEAKVTRRALNQAQERLVDIEAVRLWESRSEQGGVSYIIAHWSSEEEGGCSHTFDAARRMAAQLRERPKTLLFLAVTEEKGVRLVCARSDDLPDINAADILRSAAGALGGRGGGSPALAQGGASGASSHDEVLSTLREAVPGYKIG